ncbi:MAG: hypothetical protein HY430_01245 [Candidatus Levybacteria bacterium]|nr:hypothetical protein [Candidatus Levybacteria bacterium]
MRKSTNISLQMQDAAFAPYAVTIEQDFNEAIERIIALLPVHDVIVSMVHKAMPDISSPISGYAPNANTVIVYLDTASPYIKETFGKPFRKTLGHEMHHAKRWETPGYGRTVFEVLITEGLAQHFEEEVVEETELVEHFWGLTPEQIAQLTERGQAEFDMPLITFGDYYHNRWFLDGSEEEGIPPHAGYAIGYALVGQYLKAHPDQKASTLVVAPAGNFRAKRVIST